MTVKALKRSPLSGFLFPAGLREVPFLAQIDLRADPAEKDMDCLASTLGITFPTTPNTVSGNGGRYVLWLGPDEWLVVGAVGSETDLEARCRAGLGHSGSVVDVSANRTVIEILGKDARDVLESGCSIDLHPRAFGPGRCAQTFVARASVILHQMTDEPHYRLFVRPSFATYLAIWLCDALRATGDGGLREFR